MVMQKTDTSQVHVSQADTDQQYLCPPAPYHPPSLPPSLSTGFDGYYQLLTLLSHWLAHPPLSPASILLSNNWFHLVFMGL